MAYRLMVRSQQLSYYIYILKIGINVFCKYTAPDGEAEQAKNNNS
ncbi:MAG: hypothetical protein V7K72_10775 [Nostoc sp.]